MVDLRNDRHYCLSLRSSRVESARRAPRQGEYAPSSGMGAIHKNKKALGK